MVSKPQYSQDVTKYEIFQGTKETIRGQNYKTQIVVKKIEICLAKICQFKITKFAFTGYKCTSLIIKTETELLWLL